MLEIDKNYAELPWLSALRTELVSLCESERSPHSLLLYGRRGTGRRQLALWLVEALLGKDPLRTLAGSDEAVGHPDLLVVEPADGKASISVDQIRELVDFFRLTSHSSAGRLAIVWPAESMTVNAANSLLKTLEEPPAGSLIILISESVSRLPATIVSRCQRLRVPLPPRELAFEWLVAESGEPIPGDLLDFAGGAPLTALALHAASFGATASGFEKDIQELQQRRAIPVEVAARWSKTPDLALEWLSWRLAGEVRSALGVSTDIASGAVASADNAGIAHAGFQQMEQIRELRRLFRGGISTELSLAGLLMGWYGGLGR